MKIGDFNPVRVAQILRGKPGARKADATTSAPEQSSAVSEEAMSFSAETNDAQGSTGSLAGQDGVVKLDYRGNERRQRERRGASWPTVLNTRANAERRRRGRISFKI